MSDSDQEQNIPAHKDSTIEHFLDDVPVDTTQPRIPVVPELGVALGLLVFVFSVTYIGATNTLTKDVKSDEMRIEAKLAGSESNAQKTQNAFDDTRIEARSAIVWDVKNQKVLFNKNADDVRPLASVTKLMTALVAYELLLPDDRVTISLDDLKAEGDSGFVDGENFTMQNLMDLTLISSSNDGATALSSNVGQTITEDRNPDTVFVTAMNVKAEELGLTKTHFENSTGLDLSPEKAGAYGSARDMALLMEYIITNVNDAVELTTSDVTTVNNEQGERHIVKNTNEVVNDIDGLIASKTGYTQLAGGNLVIAFNAGLNRPIVVAVLGSSQDGRFADTLDLVERARLAVASDLE